MKLAVLVISQNQAASLPFMLEKLKNIPSIDRYWVLDRCTDNSQDILRLEPNVIINTEGEGFLAGRMRDRGLDIILQKDYDVVVFLDGDRVPNTNISPAIIEEESKNATCVLYLCYDGDIRDNPEWRLKRARNATWLTSCGMVIQVPMLKRVRAMKHMHNRCFHPDFDGEWGLEDNFLGINLYRIGGTFQISKYIKVAGTLPSFPLKTSSVNQKTKYDKLCVSLGFTPVDDLRSDPVRYINGN